MKAYFIAGYLVSYFSYFSSILFVVAFSCLVFYFSTNLCCIFFYLDKTKFKHHILTESSNKYGSRYTYLLNTNIEKNNAFEDTALLNFHSFFHCFSCSNCQRRHKRRWSSTSWTVIETLRLSYGSWRQNQGSQLAVEGGPLNLANEASELCQKQRQSEWLQLLYPTQLKISASPLLFPHCLAQSLRTVERTIHFFSQWIHFVPPLLTFFAQHADHGTLAIICFNPSRKKL